MIRISKVMYSIWDESDCIYIHMTYLSLMRYKGADIRQSVSSVYMQQCR